MRENCKYRAYGLRLRKTKEEYVRLGLYRDYLMFPYSSKEIFGTAGHHGHRSGRRSKPHCSKAYGY